MKAKRFASVAFMNNVSNTVLKIRKFLAEMLFHFSMTPHRAASCNAL